MKRISFRDVLKIPEFKDVREIDLLHPDMNARVFPYLYEMGIDVKQGVTIDASLHRDWGKKTGVGYCYLGEIRQDREYLNSKWCDIVERVVVAMQNDYSLGHDMAMLQNRQIDYKAISEEHESEWEEDGIEEDAEYEYNSKLIKQLEELKNVVRGTCNGDD